VSFDPVVLKTRLETEEGRRSHIYTDTVGKVTGGIGRNLSDVGFSDDEIDLMLRNDVKRAVEFLNTHFTWWASLDDVRQSVLVDMAFNMGASLLEFHATLAAIQNSNWHAAHDGMLNSTWAHQVGRRAQYLAQVMLTGKF